MKTNFLVSNCYNLWRSTAKSYYAMDPYIIHVLEREGLKEKYKNIKVAPLRRTNRHDLQVDHDYVDKKFRKFTTLLTKRLDAIHNVKYGSQFWEKSLSLALLRHVVMCYELFQACEQNFDKELHDCQVLDPGSYHIPVTFDEHRQFLQHTDFGQEQLFSIYCNLFYLKQFPAVKFAYSEKVSAAPAGFINRIKGSGLYIKILRRILMWLASFRQPTVGIMGSYFSTTYINQLVLKSWGKIQLIQLPIIKPVSSNIRLDLREALTQFEPDFDRFDKFIFSSLQYLMPKSFVENFNQVDKEYKLFFTKYRHLKWVVSEDWIGNEITSIALALLKQQGVNHICNEHNYLSYQFLGNSLKYQIPLVDEFVTLGWDDSSQPEVVRGASLFQWVEIDSRIKKEHEILFILGLPIAKVPEINAAYGDSGAYGAKAYIKMTQLFFARLGYETLKTLYVRSYPSWKINNWMTGSQSFAFSNYITKVKKYDDISISGRLLMQQSRLVVVNYLSTAYLESIIANIPTVFIWNMETNLISEMHKNAFEILIKAGICQTNPEAAADFINSIKDDPEKWWQSDMIQKSREEFLKTNIGEPEFLIRYLLNKSRT